MSFEGQEVEADRNRPRPCRRPGGRGGHTALVVLLVTCWASNAAAQDDTVTMKTGERLVGEIKSLEKDVLTFSTVFSDSDFAITWDQVVSLESRREFLVETFRGQRLSGPLTSETAEPPAMLVGSERVPLADVSAIQPYERSFWSRFDAGFDFGYSVVRANSAQQLTVGGKLSYRDERSIDALFLNLFRSAQSNAPETERWEIGNDYRYLLGEHWYVNTSQDFLKSDEQALDLRTTIGGGAGRFLLRSSSQYLAVGAGLAWTVEDYQDPAIDIQKSGEAYLATELMTENLRFADLLTRLTYYPSLTIDGRHRLTYKFDLDFNLPGDWYFRIGLFENYDSKPPAGLSSNDWGWSNSFGLEF